MGMSRCYSLMKGLLIVFSIIFLCVGVGACGFSCWALWETRAQETAAGRAGLLALAGWGAAGALAALLALAGSCRSSASLLAAAFSLLALTAVAEGAAAWWGAAHLPQLQLALRNTLRHTMTHDYGELAARTDIIDVIQRELKCCGADSTRDWQDSVWSRRQAAIDLRRQRGLDVADTTGADADVDADASVDADISIDDTGTLDLSVGAPTSYYYVPKSCCATTDETACEASRRVPAAGTTGTAGTAGGLQAAACGARVLGALAGGARGPLLAGGALLALHAAALLLALALCLRAPPAHRHKA